MAHTENKIAEIRDSLKTLADLRNLDEADLIVRRITRNTTALQRQFPDSKSLPLLALDLVELVRSEKNFRKLNKTKNEGNDGFSKSVKVLSAEFEQVFSELDTNKNTP